MSGVFTSPYPVFVDLVGRRALVVGGGPVAARKVAGLLEAGAQVTVVAPTAVAAIADDPDVRWHERPYRRGEVASYSIAITATDDPAVNRQVARDANAANVWVNSADDPSNCSFILPSVVTRGDLRVAVSTNGRSPAFAQWARRRVESLFDEVHARALEIVSEVRAEVRDRRGTSELDGWSEVIDDEFFDLVGSGDHRAAAARLRAAFLDHEQLDHEQLDHERLDHEQLDHERLDHEQLDHERLDHERLDHERLDHERLDHERLDHERLDHEHVEVRT